MDAAIAWLIETILATLLIDKLDAWLRRVGLADDTDKLKAEIRRIKIVVSTVKERGVGNELLAESLALLQDHLDDAGNVVDELDYYRLQQQVQGEGVTMDECEVMLGAEQVDDVSSGHPDTTMNSSVGKLRSVVWEHFTITEKDKGKPVKAKCTYCTEEFKCDTKTNGTSSMKKHLEKEHSVTCVKRPGAHAPNPSSAGEPIVTGSSSRINKGKKRRSKAWDLFDITEEENGGPIKARCKYCSTEIKCGAKYGTAGMLNHNKICKEKPGPTDQPPNPSSTSDASANVTRIVICDPSDRKRRRIDEEPAQITATNTHTPWDKTIYSNMIQKITSQLQEGRGEVSEVLKLHGSYFASNTNHHQSEGLDQHLRTSSFAPRKVYGRVAEKTSLLKMIAEDKSDCVAILPIVGIAGVGKTVLAQLVYNDQEVKEQFHHRIWVWVSRNFDEVSLTREMLDFIPQERTEVPEERHESISSFAKLQEILESRANSKRILFIFDDVWDDMTDGRWENLLKPIKFACANGSVILVTTRDASVAKMTGTTEQIRLGALEHDEFRLLFKLHAFGDENYKGDNILSDIGQKIAEKLKGNPLAAESSGKILKEKLNTDHWNNILKNEDWNSLQLRGGIMHALKLSYDQLAYSLQKCFSCCSIFPERYQFHGGELTHIWISQGFVKDGYSSKEIEQNYLTHLVNLGFFQQVEREESSPGSQTLYAVCGLMHDFARMVSLTECGTIDGLHCNKMSPTIRHLSIVTYSEYRKDEHGNIPRNEKFEKNLRDTVTSVSKLRTLVLLGHYDSFFLQLFQDIFEKAHNLRLLQMSARSADFPKCGYDKVDGALPRVLSKLYHLRVLNIGSYTDPTIPDGINNLLSLQQLVVHKGVYSSIATIDSMKSFQEPHGVNFQISSGFEITQLQSTDESVEHYMHVKTLEEAYEAVLRNSELSEKLILSWKETSADIGMELERHEPRPDVKDLRISGYNGAVWLTGPDNSISTSFQTVHIYHCEEWKILPSLERFPFLTKLMLSNLEEIKEVLVPSLEELILVQMPKLERCSCASVEGMTSRLRALQVEDCEELKEFDLFENDDKFEIEQRSWLPDLRKLILRDCPHLKVVKPLPPSTTCSELLISGASTLPSMKGASSETLQIGYLDMDGYADIDDSSDGLRILDYKILEFPNLRNLRSMRIVGCQNLISFSFEGFSRLISLRSLEISLCEQLFSPDGTHEDVTALNCKAFPSLGSLDIESCGIEGKWLSEMLRHAPQLEKLRLTECPHITTIILIEEGENSQSNHMSAREDSSSGNAADALAPTGLARDERLHIPLQTHSSLNSITIINNPRQFDQFEDDDEFEIEQRTSLLGVRKLVVLCNCPHLEVLSPLPPSTTASELFVRGVSLLPTMQGSSSENLRIGYLEDYDYNMIDEYSDELRILDDKILAFRNLTNLKSMTIGGCRNLTSFSFEGFSHLVSLKSLILQMCEKLFSSDVIAEYIFEDVTAFPSLQILSIYSCGITGEWLSLLLKHAPVLEELHLQEILAIQEGGSLPGEQYGAVTLLARDRLVQIPLNIFSSLKKITIHDCPRLTFNWSEEGFSGCTSLQELIISRCPQLLLSLVHNDGNDDPANRRLLLPASFEGLVISQNYSVETLQPCFPSDITSLKRLKLWDSPDLESLQLRSCTALEELKIGGCVSLTALEGLQSLGSLRHLDVYRCPGLGPCLESFFSRQGYELCSRLETLEITDPSVLTTSSCVGLTSLQLLKLQGLVLTEEQGRALGLLTSLQELEFSYCYDLVDLPAGLHLPPSLQQLQFIYCPKLVDLPVGLHTILSLKRLNIQSCGGILRLPETGLPLSLEELEIALCSKELADQCSLLAATSKLRVKIDWKLLVL